MWTQLKALTINFLCNIHKSYYIQVSRFSYLLSKIRKIETKHKQTPRNWLSIERTILWVCFNNCRSNVECPLWLSSILLWGIVVNVHGDSRITPAKHQDSWSVPILACVSAGSNLTVHLKSTTDNLQHNIISHNCITVLKRRVLYYI